MSKITIEGDTALAVSPEKKKMRLGLAELVGRMAPSKIDTGGICLPQGTHFAFSRGTHTILVNVVPPRRWRLKWLAADSPAPYGPGARYRNVTIALPYLVVMAVFDNMLITDASECFFTTAPLESENHELLYPALLNCSKFRVQQGHPLSWICTQKIDRSQTLAESDPNRKLRAGFRALMHCLLETGFNQSSERHEGSSWYRESAHVDDRISTVEKWERASESDPLFVLDVPWLKTGFTLRQTVDRTFQNVGAGGGASWSADSLSRLIFNFGKSV